MTVNTQEKLELAKKLNLTHQISILEYSSEMFDLKFKPITMKEIVKRLSFNKWVIRKVPTICASLMIILSILFTIIMKIPILASIFVIVPLTSLWFSHSFQQSMVVNCWVDDFRYEMPYGAMLALKEAGEKGIVEHRVWYPTLSSPIDILTHDPIITGITKNGALVEIYAWNENDVYES